MADAAKVLDDVKGVGPSTRDALLERYPTLNELALAREDELTEVRGVGPATARAIKQAVGSAVESAATADLADSGETTPRDAVAVASSTSESPAAAETPSDRAAEPAREVPRQAAAELPARGGTTAASQRPARPTATADEPMTRVKQELEDTLQSVRDAALAVGGVIVAAVSAGRRQLPEVTENLREAGESASRTASDLVAVVRRRTGR